MQAGRCSCSAAVAHNCGSRASMARNASAHDPKICCASMSRCAAQTEATMLHGELRVPARVTHKEKIKS